MCCWMVALADNVLLMRWCALYSYERDYVLCSGNFGRLIRTFRLGWMALGICVAMISNLSIFLFIFWLFRKLLFFLVLAKLFGDVF